MASQPPGASLFPRLPPVTPVAAAWRRWAGQLKDLLFPPLCATCGVSVTAAGQLCGACWGKLTFLDGPACVTCGLPFPFEVGENAQCGRCLADPPAFGRVVAALVYDDAARGVILPYKHADRLDMTPQLADWLARAAVRGGLARPDLVAPVPMHPRRLLARRYNQAAVLAHGLSQRLGVPAAVDLLQRTRRTPSQGGLGRDARRLNVKGAFAVRDKYQASISGRDVLVVDDVMTTGATLDVCAQALKKAGARRVTAVVIARATGSD